jgi:glutamate---cysteine ligase / carboxylate-amine ligase
VFDAADPLTVGVEEEVMLLDPETLDLAPCAPQILARLDGDPRFKPELPAAQLEIKTEPTDGVEAVIAALAAGRRDLSAAARGLARPAAAGLHPFAAPEGELSESARYDELRDRYGRVARWQLVAGLQVHIAIGDAERTLAVYNALRGHLPDIAALAANAAFYAGEDAGMASVRPLVAQLLPRQGMPPAIESWDHFAGELRWAATAGLVPEPRRWWWELRPHAGFGTLEVRVPDAQTTLADAGAIVAFVHALAAWLSALCDEGRRLEAHPSWRIEENRWSAARYGIEGEMADFESGAVEPTRRRLNRLLDALGPFGDRLGSSAQLEEARRLVEANGAIRQRRLVERVGLDGMVGWFAEHFLD